MQRASVVFLLTAEALARVVLVCCGCNWLLCAVVIHDVASYTTDSGIVVTDRRHRAEPPRDNLPNGNVAPEPISVGPDASEGFGNTNVMRLADEVVPQAWSGWPVEWRTPRWGAGSVGLSELMSRVSTVWACIDLNASVLASMPPYRTSGGKVIEPLPWMANPQPEVYTGWVEFAKQLVVAYHQGEAFVWATSRYADGTVKTFVMLNPAFVNVEIVGAIRRYTLGGLDITDDVLHIRYASWPGDARGHGPLEAAARTLVSSEALERYSAELARRGGVPWAALTIPGNLRADQAKDLRDNFVRSRLDAMGAPAVLSGGATLQQLQVSPKDMALLELRQFDESRLAILLGVPPFLVGLPSGGDSMTYSNTSALFDYHWRAGLRPKAAMIMEALSNWALVRGQAVEVNRDEYVRPSFGERVSAYAALHGIVDDDGRRAMTIEEIRRAERLESGGNAVDAVTSVSL